MIVTDQCQSARRSLDSLRTLGMTSIAVGCANSVRPEFQYRDGLGQHLGGFYGLIVGIPGGANLDEQRPG